jgi:hypothetical protein
VAPVDTLVRSTGEFDLRVEDPPAVLAAIRAQPWGASARMEGARLLSPSPTGQGRDLVDALVGLGIHPEGIAERTVALDDVFLNLTRGGGER